MNYLYTLIVLNFLPFLLIGQIPENNIEAAHKGTVIVEIGKTTTLASRIKDFRGQLAEEEWQRILQELKLAKGNIGSGFAINYQNRLFIVTNFHVIQAADTTDGSILIRTKGGESFSARYLDGDPFIDVAFLEPMGKIPLSLHPLSCSKDKLQARESLHAIGHPIGPNTKSNPFTVTSGPFSTEGNYNHLTGQYGFLRHGAYLKKGNSGGPLLNNAGQVVGINTQQPNSKEKLDTINLSIPIQRALILLDQYLKFGKMPRRCYLGAEFRATSGDGPRLYQIIEDGPAAGQLSDYIGARVKAVNGKTIKDIYQLLEALELAGTSSILSLSLETEEGVKQVSIPVKPLEKEDLAATAIHVIEKFGEINDKRVPFGLYLKKAPQSGKLSGSGDLNKKPNDGWRIEWVGDRNYGWPIASLADFGAAVRLTSFQGKLNLRISNLEFDDGASDNIEYTFGSTSDNTPQQIIFY